MDNIFTELQERFQREHIDPVTEEFTLPVIIQEFDNDGILQNLSYNIIIVPENVRGGYYRQIVSIGSLEKRLLKLSCEIRAPQMSCLSKLAFLRTSLYRFYENMGDGNHMLRGSIVYHNSVWDFYDYIGYDHKNRTLKHLKKFITSVDRTDTI